MIGFGFKNWTSGKNFRVIYHKNIDKNVKEDEIKQKIERMKRNIILHLM